MVSVCKITSASSVKSIMWREFVFWGSFSLEYVHSASAISSQDNASRLVHRFLPVTAFLQVVRVADSEKKKVSHRSVAFFTFVELLASRVSNSSCSCPSSFASNVSISSSCPPKSRGITLQTLISQSGKVVAAHLFHFPRPWLWLGLIPRPWRPMGVAMRSRSRRGIQRSLARPHFLFLPPEHGPPSSLIRSPSFRPSGPTWAP